MHPNDINVFLMEKVAAPPLHGHNTWERDWLADFVFVGGAVAGLLITDRRRPQSGARRMLICGWRRETGSA